MHAARYLLILSNLSMFSLSSECVDRSGLFHSQTGRYTFWDQSLADLHTVFSLQNKNQIEVSKYVLYAHYYTLKASGKSFRS